MRADRIVERPQPAGCARRKTRSGGPGLEEPVAGRLVDEGGRPEQLRLGQLDLLGQVRSLARQDGYTVLSTLHDLNLVARYCDQVALLVDGRIVRHGTVDAVLTAGVLSQAYHVPLEVLRDTPSGYPVVLPAILQ